MRYLSLRHSNLLFFDVNGLKWSELLYIGKRFSPQPIHNSGLLDFACGSEYPKLLTWLIVYNLGVSATLDSLGHKPNIHIAPRTLEITATKRDVPLYQFNIMISMPHFDSVKFATLRKVFPIVWYLTEKKLYCLAMRYLHISSIRLTMLQYVSALSHAHRYTHTGRGGQ